MRQELIHRISGIDDIEFLNAIKTILDYKRKESFIELSSAQEEELLYASNEGRKGNVIAQTAIDQKVDEWLSEK